jgi:hypothetical protein
VAHNHCHPLYRVNGLDVKNETWLNEEFNGIFNVLNSEVRVATVSVYNTPMLQFRRGSNTNF